MCNKIDFESKSDALKYGRVWRKSTRLGNYKNAKSGRKLRAYDCPHCEYWHLTSSKPRKWSKAA